MASLKKLELCEISWLLSMGCSGSTRSSEAGRGMGNHDSSQMLWIMENGGEILMSAVGAVCLISDYSKANRKE